ncbi:MAG: tRNA (adenine(22)-N(1))-methyltransferase [Lachnospirales bacterium]
MLSYRLEQVASYVEKCNVVADIGTDHGYIPVYLVKNKICNKAIAADISKGSCKKAENNIKISNLTEYIDVRCGNGLEVIDTKNDNVDCIIISGMGGLLTINVIKKNIDVLQTTRQLILQPQRDIDKVREFVIENGFNIISEKMIKENEKYYTIINAVKGKSDKYNEIDLLFGKFLIKEKSSVLKEYLTIEMNKILNAVNSLKNNINNNNQKRYDELLHLYNIYKEVYKCL